MLSPLTNPHHFPGYPKNGFILFEVLVAMSLILGAWMNFIQSYQALSLKLTQQEKQKALVRKEQDVFESGLMVKGISNEFARMSGRTNYVHAATQSASQNQR
ncbi:hypothetical protein [Polynucleobacter sp. AP-Kolm-20A-A1]|uniref:hypothetical protein n=1 Tax=Polynucleobacter sp. AP-Kolm-20A-A1 TaxID=2081041 RepID=UPI001BFD55FA|nr:hypothetical protein [Polynucleobacter sp. AP-Kolm-20A-A1]QWE20876.1 hypothetical protein C2745_01400 [Polynucleobacter sp. AP-Kolm-20A-A1]